jgi:hypothetical protein
LGTQISHFWRPFSHLWRTGGAFDGRGRSRE